MVAVAVLLVAALAGAPARAADTVGMVPSAPGASSEPIPVDPSTTGGTGQSPPTAPQDNTATNTQTTTATGGAGGAATGGNAGPSQVAGATSRGGDAYANGGKAESHSSLGNEQSSQTSGRDGRAKGENWGGDDTYMLEATKPRHPGGAARRTKHARSPRSSGSRAPGAVTRLGTHGRLGGHKTGTGSVGGGLPGRAPRLPDQNPFLSLLSAPGGAGAGLMLLLLAVLGAAIALPRDRFNAFRTPTLPWRPLAYVPPIELPG